MTSKAVNSGINKLISTQVEAKKENVPWDKPVKSILKWQLYYHMDEKRNEALSCMKQGIEACIQVKVIKGKEECYLSELSDRNNNWRCLRIEFLTRYYLEFKRIMRDTVGGYEQISMTTVQPKNVNLYQEMTDEAVYRGSITGLVNWISQ